MAHVIADESQPVEVSTVYSWWKVAVAGALIGLVYWALASMIAYAVIDPLYCHSVVSTRTCANAVDLSGNIASILAAVGGLGVLVWLKVLRPLIVVVAALAVLWGIAGWTKGLGWAEIAVWSTVLYALTYSLFGWICRYSRSVTVLIGVVAVIIVARIIISL